MAYSREGVGGDRPIRKGRRQIDDLDAGTNKLPRAMTSLTPRSIGARLFVSPLCESYQETEHSSAEPTDAAYFFLLTSTQLEGHRAHGTQRRHLANSGAASTSSDEDDECVYHSAP